MRPAVWEGEGEGGRLAQRRALLCGLGRMGTAIIGWYDHQGIIRRALTKGGLVPESGYNGYNGTKQVNSLKRG